MRAIVIDEFGGPEKLRLDDVPDPKVGPDTVLIRIQAAGVNPVDTKVRGGYLEPAFPHHFPLIPGWDAAGTVEAVGPAVVDLLPGDAVFAYCRKTEISGGTYAELVAVPAGAVTRTPDRASMVQAGGIPLAGLTAWQALVEGARLERGQTVLIQAAAGGVGHFAVQIAKALGARVVGTASPRNHDWVRALGADAVVDYHEDDLAGALRDAAPEGYDGAFDLFGGDELRVARDILKPGGHIVSIAQPDPAQGRDDVRGRYTFVRPSARELGELAILVDEGKLEVEVMRSFPLEQAADAHRLVEEGHVRGKVVLEV